MSSSSLRTVPPETRLAALRAELDQVDDVLHDALMRRAELVAEVAASRAKGKVPMRPGREAAIIRRLLARNHGALHPALLVRIWREMISGFTVQQRPMQIAVDGEGLLPLAAAQFGALAAIDVADGPAAALARIAAGEATVAVLRWPGAWWTALLDERAATLHVVARLPFWEVGSVVAAMVLTEAPPDPSGQDRTLIGTKLAPDALPAEWRARVIAGDAAGPSLLDVDGFVGEDALPRALSGRVLGAYATPLGALE